MASLRTPTPQTAASYILASPHFCINHLGMMDIAIVCFYLTVFSQYNARQYFLFSINFTPISWIYPKLFVSRVASVALRRKWSAFVAPAQPHKSPSVALHLGRAKSDADEPGIDCGSAPASSTAAASRATEAPVRTGDVTRGRRGGGVGVLRLSDDLPTGVAFKLESEMTITWRWENCNLRQWAATLRY